MIQGVTYVMLPSHHAFLAKFNKGHNYKRKEKKDEKNGEQISPL